jgi:hypothetical protein
MLHLLHNPKGLMLPGCVEGGNRWVLKFIVQYQEFLPGEVLTSGMLIQRL